MNTPAGGTSDWLERLLQLSVEGCLETFTGRADRIATAQARAATVRMDDLDRRIDIGQADLRTHVGEWQRTLNVHTHAIEALAITLSETNDRLARRPAQSLQDDAMPAVMEAVGEIRQTLLSQSNAIRALSGSLLQTIEIFKTPETSQDFETLRLSLDAIGSRLETVESSAAQTAGVLETVTDLRRLVLAQAETATAGAARAADLLDAVGEIGRALTVQAKDAEANAAHTSAVLGILTDVRRAVAAEAEAGAAQAVTVMQGVTAVHNTVSAQGGALSSTADRTSEVLERVADIRRAMSAQVEAVQSGIVQAVRTLSVATADDGVPMRGSLERAERAFFDRAEAAIARLEAERAERPRAADGSTRRDAGNQAVAETPLDVEARIEQPLAPWRDAIAEAQRLLSTASARRSGDESPLSPASETPSSVAAPRLMRSVMTTIEARLSAFEATGDIAGEEMRRITREFPDIAGATSRRLSGEARPEPWDLANAV